MINPCEQKIKLYHDKRPDILENFNLKSSGFSNDNSKNSKQNSLLNKKQIFSPSPIKTYESNRCLSMSCSSNFFKSNSEKENLFTDSKRKLKIKENNIRKSPSKTTTSTKKNYTSNSFLNNNKKYSSPKLESRIPIKENQQRIIRTIIMPNDSKEKEIHIINTNNIENNNNEDFTLYEKEDLNNENEFLRNQLEKIKKYYENLLLQMEENDRIKYEENKTRSKIETENIGILHEKLKTSEKFNYEITKEFMQFKYDTSKKETELYEEIEVLRLQVESLSNTIENLVENFKKDKVSSDKQNERKMKEISSLMRNQVS
jgi:hypothetical protein